MLRITPRHDSRRISLKRISRIQFQSKIYELTSSTILQCSFRPFYPKGSLLCLFASLLLLLIIGLLVDWQIFDVSQSETIVTIEVEEFDLDGNKAGDND